jgi:hypothetical protein
MSDQSPAADPEPVHLAADQAQTHSAAGQAQTHPGTPVRTIGLTAGVAGLFLLLRLFAVSNWDWHTAADVVESVDPDDAVSILFGTLVAIPTVTAALVAVLLPVAFFDLVRPRRAGPRWRWDRVMLVAALVVTCVALVKTFHDWWMPVAELAVSAVLVAEWVLWRHSRGRQVVRWVTHKIGAAALVAFLVLAAVVQTPWTPEERIVTRNGVLDGYVLKVESGYLKVLTAADRRFVIVNRSDVKSRRSLPPH